MLAEILFPLMIVPNGINAKIPAEPQWRHIEDTKGLSFRVEVELNDVTLGKD